MTILNFTKSFTSEQNEALQSYSETLAFIVATVFDNEQRKVEYQSKKGKKYVSNYQHFCKQYPENEYGFIERLNVCIAWAKEFEQTNEGREWDGEWMEELDTFISSKLNS